MNQEKLLQGLNENQKKAVLHKDNPCLVISSAGSGKTSVLTKRIANLISNENISPSNILAVTFTSKAAKEMKERLYKLIGDKSNLVTMGTFHSICLHMLKEQNYLNPKIQISKDWQQEKFIQQIFKENKFMEKLTWDISQCLAFINIQKNNLIDTNDDLFIIDECEFLRPQLETLYKQYEKIKEDNNCIDFTDMLFKCYKMLNENKTIKEYYQNKYKYILVDEFQDTNKLQYELLRILLNDKQNIFAVGDDKQSIYGFTGANVNLMINFQKDYINANIINMDINYRSTKNIVDLSNKLIWKNKNQLKSNTKANKGIGQEVVFNSFYNEDSEGKYITNEISKLHNTYNYSDISILYRCNAQSRAIEDALIKSKIPYIILSGINFLQRKEILDITAYLRVIQNTTNNTALTRIINIPNRYLGKVFIDKITKYANNNNKSIFDCLADSFVVHEKRYWVDNSYELYDIINEFTNKKLKPIDLINNIILRIDYIKYLQGLNGENNILDRIENIEAFKNLAKQFNTLDGFLKHIDTLILQANDNNSKSDKVKLMTMHKSKGLEFPVVFCIGINDEIIPHKKSNNIEEERRICYVGISRAKEQLYISWNLNYNCKPITYSPFINDMISKTKIKSLESTALHNEFDKIENN